MPKVLKPFEPRFAVVITGHRPDRMGELWSPKDWWPAIYYVRDQVIHLTNLVGETVFFNGFAEGADLIFAAGILKAKEMGAPVQLVAAIPFDGDTAGFRNPLAVKWHDRFLELADEVHICSERAWDYYTRNWWMSRQPSERNLPGACWAYYDGEPKSGTAQTIRACRVAGLPIDTSFYRVLRQQLGIDHLEEPLVQVSR